MERPGVFRDARIFTFRPMYEYIPIIAETAFNGQDLNCLSNHSPRGSPSRLFCWAQARRGLSAGSLKSGRRSWCRLRIISWRISCEQSYLMAASAKWVELTMKPRPIFLKTAGEKGPWNRSGEEDRWGVHVLFVKNSSTILFFDLKAFIKPKSWALELAQVSPLVAPFRSMASRRWPSEPCQGPISSLSGIWQVGLQHINLLRSHFGPEFASCKLTQPSGSPVPMKSCSVPYHHCALRVSLYLINHLTPAWPALIMQLVAVVAVNLRGTISWTASNPDIMLRLCHTFSK